MYAHQVGLLARLMELLSGRKKLAPADDMDWELPNRNYRHPPIVYRMPVAVQ